MGKRTGAATITTLTACFGLLISTGAGAQDSAQLAYRVELESSSGHSLGSWAKAEGLDVSWDVVEYNDSPSLWLRKRPGRSKLMLTGGTSSSVELESWWKLAATDKSAKRTLKLAVVDRSSNKRSCAFSLSDSSLQSFQKRTVVRDGKKVQLIDLELLPGKLSHSCAELFKHPRERKKN